MKITKQRLKQIIQEELNKLREADNPFASDGTGLPRHRERDKLRRTAANTRGTGPYSSQPEADASPPTSTDQYFGIFKLQQGYETQTAVSDSLEGIEAEFESWNPRPHEGDRIAAIIHGRLIQGKTDTD